MRKLIWAMGLLAAVAGCGARQAQPVATTTTTETTTETRLAFFPTPKFDDLDAYDWQGRGPHHYPVHGIDVSKYQGNIDWNRVRRSGVSFAFIKATEGGDHMDEMFAEHWKGARQAGMRRGAYHYFYFCRPAREQARWFIDNVPREASGLPHVLDMEWNPFSPTCTLRPDGATVRREAKIFLDMLERHYGRRPIIYTTIDFFRDTGIGQLGGTDFWLRSVAGHPSEKYGNARWTFWQYTGTGVVPGVNGPVDINVFAGNADTWQRWPG